MPGDSGINTSDFAEFVRKFARTWTMKNGVEVSIRPIHPEDEPLMAKFHTKLSDRSVYLRYFHNTPLNYRISHERLSKLCFLDYDREIALVAIKQMAETKEDEILGVGRLVKLPAKNVAEFAIVISDEYQKLGLGTELLTELVEIGKVEKLDSITGDILFENQGMQKTCKKLGFKLKYLVDEHIIRAEILF